jgi:three-Cys-motif partner protein
LQFIQKAWGAGEVVLKNCRFIYTPKYIHMNQFGGNWTEVKMQIVVSYAKAYLTIMKEQKWAKTIYFDGFAGSGIIETNEAEEITKGTALRILDIVEPASFDMYYFVEINEQHTKELQERIHKYYFGKNAHVVQADCNEKLIKLAEYLKANKKYRALVFIDPYGMSINWNSIEALIDLGVDLWILIPTGIAVNRLLKKDGNISEAWLKKLESFLGINRDIIKAKFYKQFQMPDLFGDPDSQTTLTFKENNAIKKIHEVYKERLKTVFKFVSEPFVLRNSSNSIMYHFLMTTNNKNAFNIANDIVKSKYRL